MIRIEIGRCKKPICKFKVSGHAGYDYEGSDIVCSAVTAVVYGALGALEEICGLTEYEDVEMGLESDYIAFEVPKNISASIYDKTQIILETMCIGLKQIEFVYGEYVKINEREV